MRFLFRALSYVLSAIALFVYIAEIFIGVLASLLEFMVDIVATILMIPVWLLDVIVLGLSKLRKYLNKLYNTTKEKR